MLNPLASEVSEKNFFGFLKDLDAWIENETDTELLFLRTGGGSNHHASSSHSHNYHEPQYQPNEEHDEGYGSEGHGGRMQRSVAGRFENYVPSLRSAGMLNEVKEGKEERKQRKEKKNKGVKK